MISNTWLLPVLVLASLERVGYAEPSGPIRTDRFNADQLEALYKEEIFPIDDSETTLALGSTSEPEAITLTCLAGAEIDHANDLLEGTLTLKRDASATPLQYRDQFGGVWLATVDPSKGTISLRPREPRGYRFAVKSDASGLDMREIVHFKVLQRILAAAAAKPRPQNFAATHDELPGNALRAAQELQNPQKP